MAVPLALAWGLIVFLHANFVSPRLIEEYHGLVKLRLKLPGTAEGIEEPLLTVGKAGEATFVYIRILKHAQARVGIEFWGYTAMESDPFPLPAQDAEINLVTSFPALFRKIGDRGWSSVPEAEQRRLRSHYFVAVDGVLRLSGPIDHAQAPDAPIYLGENPIGGSFVSEVFTGRVISWSRPR
jgi:hypothetical protein